MSQAVRLPRAADSVLLVWFVKKLNSVACMNGMSLQGLELGAGAAVGLSWFGAHLQGFSRNGLLWRLTGRCCPGLAGF